MMVDIMFAFSAFLCLPPPGGFLEGQILAASGGFGGQLELRQPARGPSSAAEGADAFDRVP